MSFIGVKLENGYIHILANDQFSEEKFDKEVFLGFLGACDAECLEKLKKEILDDYNKFLNKAFDEHKKSVFKNFQNKLIESFNHYFEEKAD